MLHGMRIRLIWFHCGMRLRLCPASHLPIAVGETLSM